MVLGGGTLLLAGALARELWVALYYPHGAAFWMREGRPEMAALMLERYFVVKRLWHRRDSANRFTLAHVYYSLGRWQAALDTCALAAGPALAGQVEQLRAD